MTQKSFKIFLSDKNARFKLWGPDYNIELRPTRKTELIALESLILLAFKEAKLPEHCLLAILLQTLDNLSDDQEYVTVFMGELILLRRGYSIAQNEGKKEPSWLKLCSLFKQLWNLGNPTIEQQQEQPQK